jgi:hypothetical protein
LEAIRKLDSFAFEFHAFGDSTLPARRLLVGARAHVTLYEFRMLPQYFSLERVALLTTH